MKKTLFLCSMFAAALCSSASAAITYEYNSHTVATIHNATSGTGSAPTFTASLVEAQTVQGIALDSASVTMTKGSGESQSYTPTAYTGSFAAPNYNVGASGRDTESYEVSFTLSGDFNPQAINFLSFDLITFNSGGKSQPATTLPVTGTVTMKEGNTVYLDGVQLQKSTGGTGNLTTAVYNNDGTINGSPTYATLLTSKVKEGATLESGKTYTLTLSGIDVVNHTTGCFVGVGNIALTNQTYTVSVNDATYKTYTTMKEVTDNTRIDAIHADTGVEAYLVQNGSEVWFAATQNDADEVVINSDLFLNGNRSDNYGALRMDTSSGKKLTLKGDIVLGSDTVISSHRYEATNYGTIEIAGDVSGADADGNKYALTINTRFSGSPMTFSGEVNVGNMTTNCDVAFSDSAMMDSLTLNNGASLTLNAGSSLTLGAEHDGVLTTTALTLNGNATINADLVMTSGTLTFAQDSILTMGCSVTIGNGVAVHITSDDVAAIRNGQAVTIMNLGTLTAQDVITLGQANIYVNNALQSDFRLMQVTDTDGTSRIVVAPEPATATLSLLALAGLCARRKRK